MTAKSLLPWIFPRFFGPRCLGLSVILLLLAFAAFHGLGWRVNTSLLSGTCVDYENPGSGQAQGVVYIVSYVATVVLVPIFVISAGIQGVFRRFLRSKKTPR